MHGKFGGEMIHVWKSGISVVKAKRYVPHQVTKEDEAVSLSPFVKTGLIISFKRSRYLSNVSYFCFLIEV